MTGATAYEAELFGGPCDGRTAAMEAIHQEILLTVAPPFPPASLDLDSVVPAPLHELVYRVRRVAGRPTLTRDARVPYDFAGTRPHPTP
jgi:hypothetical protein